MAVNLEQLKINLEQILNKYGEAIIKEINNQLINKGIKPSEHITFHIKEENSILSLEISVPQYIKYINSGKKAGSMPPIDQILDWIVKNNIQPIKKGDGIPRKSKSTIFEKQKRQAFAIARGIEKKGIKAKRVIQPAISKAVQGIEAELPSEIAGPIQQIITQGLIDAFQGVNNVQIT